MRPLALASIAIAFIVVWQIGIIIGGNLLRLPNLVAGAAATAKPVPDVVSTRIPTNSPVPTSTGTPTRTPSNSPLPTSTGTPTSTPTNSPLPTSTGTPTGTPTAVLASPPAPTATPPTRLVALWRCQRAQRGEDPNDWEAFKQHMVRLQNPIWSGPPPPEWPNGVAFQFDANCQPTGKEALPIPRPVAQSVEPCTQWFSTQLQLPAGETVGWYWDAQQDQRLKVLADVYGQTRSIAVRLWDSGNTKLVDQQVNVSGQVNLRAPFADRLHFDVHNAIGNSSEIADVSVLLCRS